MCSNFFCSLCRVPWSSGTKSEKRSKIQLRSAEGDAILAGTGMLRRRSGWEVKNIISNYSKMLLEKSLQVSRCICRCLNTFRNLATSLLLQMLKNRQQSETSKRCKKDKFLLPLAKWKENTTIFVEKTADSKYQKLSLSSFGKWCWRRIRSLQNFVVSFQWTIQELPSTWAIPGLDGWATAALCQGTVQHFSLTGL